jgi:hypothetical protein
MIAFTYLSCHFDHRSEVIDMMSFVWGVCQCCMWIIQIVVLQGTSVALRLMFLLLPQKLTGLCLCVFICFNIIWKSVASTYGRMAV